ncbi:hypothetical protein JL107_14015 [Nakamurella flavida]|uniref:WXG100 family type VII secretion target n=1 Tax=Nakamurella flavida TaxID=363630 RepID=A0A938YKC5_9ACTN|nr:hypothetical protein [Nakamurella flavida]MBM9477562.1 hypothetical protein [Nakamurella flavida]MDP9779110.1 uncharacterized protein YukE [Nakamurella flavida]
MATIAVNYAALTNGYDSLVATWGRIEQHLAELDATLGATADMQADTLLAYRSLKARWDASAAERQIVLRSLAESVASAGERYRQVDAAMAAQFAM